MKLIRSLLSLYSLHYPATLTYMLQASEYHSDAYLKWLHRTHDFSRVEYRRKLDLTLKAKLIKLSITLGILVQILGGLALIVYGAITPGASWAWEFGAALVIVYPIIWPYLVILPLELGRLVIVEPSQARQVEQTEEIFKSHQATKIAVAGSYGKTSMKELLSVVLGSKKIVAATVANHNVAIEHAKFARKLTGKEEILIIEYGEGGPGDVARFSQHTHPDIAIITGLAPAHLDRYKSLAQAGKDILSLADYVDSKNVYLNGDSSALSPFIKNSYHSYTEEGVGKWKVSDVSVSITGTSFSLQNSKQKLNLTSGLLGRHQIGPLSLAAMLGLKFGLNNKEVEQAIAETKPYEHRMQPYELSGAWIIDDTYNGNVDGIKAGTELLHELPAKRKIYVTPGLVDQGSETKTVHLRVGQLIAAAQPDVVVLMQNSVTGFIQEGLKEGNFKGELKLVSDPLDFYRNLESFVAAGDLVLMQNDWTDNYA